MPNLNPISCVQLRPALMLRMAPEYEVPRGGMKCISPSVPVQHQGDAVNMCDAT